MRAVSVSSSWKTTFYTCTPRRSREGEFMQSPVISTSETVAIAVKAALAMLRSPLSAQWQTKKQPIVSISTPAPVERRVAVS